MIDLAKIASLKKYVDPAIDQYIWEAKFRDELKNLPFQEMSQNCAMLLKEWISSYESEQKVKIKDSARKDFDS